MKSTLEISIDALLGELSEIKAENGIGQVQGGAALQLNSSIHFNGIESSSVQEESGLPLQLPTESASELAFEDVKILVDDELIGAD